MRPLPDGFVNSESATPILRSTHSSASTRPVAIAKCGMFPSLLLVGSRVPFGPVPGSGVSTHEGRLLIVICRRQRPSWITSGMLLPAGMFASLKVPFAAVVVETSGDPDACAPQLSQLPLVIPVGSAATAA